MTHTAENLSIQSFSSLTDVLDLYNEILTFTAIKGLLREILKIQDKEEGEQDENSLRLNVSTESYGVFQVFTVQCGLKVSIVSK